MAVRPAAVAADGNIRICFATTLTVGAPTVAQLNAAVDLSYYLTPDGFAPSVDEQEITDDRLADTQTFENRGRYKLSLGNLRYVINPASPANNAAYTALAPGQAGFLVVRWGVLADTVWTAAQIVDIYPVIMGVRTKQPPEANSVLHGVQRAFVTNSRQEDVAVAA